VTTEPAAADDRVYDPPEILPIFPLTGALLLPGGRMPLFVSEERYVRMIQDAMVADRCIGLIQPAPTPAADGALEPAGERDEAEPTLYRIGCAGRIEHWEPLTPLLGPAGERYLVLLNGLRRFRWRRELPTWRGYRRVHASYQEFAHDDEDARCHFDPAPLLAALDGFGRDNHLELQIDRLSNVSGLALLNSMAMALPFPPWEKQALLEASNVVERKKLLLALMGMGLELRTNIRPTIH
jgi:Lon protease-like protein